MSADYSFHCNRCLTHAHDASRAGIELFSQHHVQTMHPIYAEAPAMLQPKQTLRRRWPSSQPLSTKRRAVPVGDRGQQT